MKKVIVTLAACALFMNMAVAGNNPTAPSAIGMAAYKVVNSNAIKVIVVSPSQENVTIKIKDETGKVIFTDVVRNEEKFSRKYIFNAESSNSNYTIEVVNSQGSNTQEVAF